ncbi:MAG: hypothetical protein IPI20_07425 [Rhodoferax sp.]|nr:hypothetical protein [Rhodoferax sp.]
MVAGLVRLGPFYRSPPSLSPTQGLDVFQRGGGGRHVFTAAHPAGHHAMHLAATVL